jgi:hypothetical protein
MMSKTNNLSNAKNSGAYTQEQADALLASLNESESIEISSINNTYVRRVSGNVYKFPRKKELFLAFYIHMNSSDAPASGAVLCTIKNVNLICPVPTVAVGTNSNMRRLRILNEGADIVITTDDLSDFSADIFYAVSCVLPIV